MEKLMSPRTVGWLAIVGGVINLIGYVFLFFILEAPTLINQGATDSRPIFGSLNDASYALFALLMLPSVCTCIAQWERKWLR